MIFSYGKWLDIACYLYIVYIVFIWHTDMQNIQTTTQSPERFFRISLPKKLQYVIAGGALSLVYSL